MTDTLPGFADYFEQRAYQYIFDRIDVFIDWKKIERVLENRKTAVPMEDPLIRHFPCSNYRPDGKG